MKPPSIRKSNTQPEASIKPICKVQKHAIKKKEALKNIFRNSASELDQENKIQQIAPISTQACTLALKKAGQNFGKLTSDLPDKKKVQALQKVFGKSKLNAKISPKKPEESEIDEWDLKDHPSWEILFNMLEPKADRIVKATDQMPYKKKFETYVRLREHMVRLENKLFGKSPPMPEQYCHCCLKKAAYTREI